MPLNLVFIAKTFFAVVCFIARNSYISYKSAGYCIQFSTFVVIVFLLYPVVLPLKYKFGNSKKGKVSYSLLIYSFRRLVGVNKYVRYIRLNHIEN